MDILNLLQQYGILSTAVVIGIIALMTQLRKVFLDTFIEKIKQGWIRWLITTGIALIISIGLTAIVSLTNFIFFEWVKMSILNWIFSWVFYDTIKNLFFKEKKDENLDDCK